MPKYLLPKHHRDHAAPRWAVLRNGTGKGR